MLNFLLLPYLFVEEHLSVSLFLATGANFFLQVLHEFDLLSKSLSPELLPFVVLTLPVSQLSLKILNIFSVGIVDSQIILFFLLEEAAFPFGP